MARKQLQNLTEPMYYVMLSLLKPIHGYGIMKNVDKITKGRVKVGAGTLYALLSRFEKEKIVKKVSSEDGKKIYVLIEKGLEILEDEHARLKLLVEDGNLLLGEISYEEEN
ncbi:PadR family transcriptional regulator [Oceanirhabdus sp. W0125-5]|uniref:PadR family transcriptional regulator n=1 Tax=Oceanirhabdus sp. W0125-5 TaxID=2999116 RepID=UPI0022F2A8AB|nr:PadR family transcriptional regulator [Oceanirhabdus sp. W0125-5]WBW99342.1 PadR family transcriptional regulator [Oceanirhabdus sp. W0125-5]